MIETIVAAGGLLGLLLVVLLIVVAILWIVLPFAIFGIKPKLDGIAKSLVTINTNLCTVARLLKPIAEQHGYSQDSSTEGPMDDKDVGGSAE